jgi:hypothetical protein
MIIILILVVILIPGCRNNSAYNNIDETPNISSLNNSKPIDFTELIEFTIYYKNIQKISDQVWRDYILETYNIQLDPVPQTADNGIWELESLQKSGKLQGILALYNGEFNSMFTDINQYAVSISNYLESNIIWQSLPDDYKTAAKIGVDTWAIPIQYKPYGDQMRLRIYNRDILNQLGKDKPTTISGFYELAKSVQESGLIDYVVPVEKSNPFNSLYDIFWAYDIPLSCTDVTITSIQYDYEQGVFRDYSNDNKMKEALEAIQHLYMTNIISIPEDNSDLGILFNMGKAFTIQNMIYDRQKLTDIQYDNTLLLDESIDIRIPVNKTSGFYILLKDTIKPESVVDRIVNAFLNTEEDNISAYLGNDKTKYTVKPDFIVYDGNLYNGAPALFREVITEKAVVAKYRSSRNEDITVSDKELNSYEEQYLYFINNVNKERFLGVNPYYDYIRKSNEEISSLFNQYFKEVFYSTVSLDDIYAAYNAEMIKLGASEYIESLNEKINSH